MEEKKYSAIIEAILFAAGREVTKKELILALEINEEKLNEIMDRIIIKYNNEDSGIEVIKIEDKYQMLTKPEYYEYIYPIFDKRSKPNLTQAALETLSIIAYNPRITRAEIETIRGVNSDGTIYKLLDYNLIEDAGKLDAPGRPTTYKVSTEFYRLFGIKNINELPKLPKYKLNENKQIVIDEIIEQNESNEDIE